jgi:hypothetical protein
MIYLLIPIIFLFLFMVWVKFWGVGLCESLMYGYSKKMIVKKKKRRRKVFDEKEIIKVIIYLGIGFTAGFIYGIVVISNIK